MVVEAHFQDGRAHGPFHTTLNGITDVFDLTLGQYTEGIPTGRWINASHGNQCALEQGDCDVQCVEYVRTGPAHAGAFDLFGESVSISDDGDTLAVGANSEASAATGINGN